MQINREDLNPCTVKLDIVCDPNEVTEGFDVAYRLLTKKVRLPGFRPGKAPRSMLEPMLSVAEWNDQAAEEMVRKAYSKAVESENLEIDRTTLPHVTISAIDKAEKKFEFSVKVPLPPKVELGDYKGLPAIQPSADVSDDEVEYELEELRKRGQTHAPITDRGLEEGDVAVLNIKVEGDAGEGKTIVTIAGQNFPELDDAIRGMHVEEIKNAELKFPADFQQAELAGRSVKAQVTINSVSGVSLPPLDDSFAKSLKTESVEELRNRVREAIGSAKQNMIGQVVHERLVDALMDRSEVAVSDNMWENLANKRLNELAEEQATHKKSLTDYAADNGMSLDEFTKAWQSKAKLEVERALLVQAVYGKEEMQVDTNDLNQELYSMAREYSMEPIELLEQLKQANSIEELHFRALTKKVGDFLLSNAMLSTGEEESAPKVKAKASTAEKETSKAKPTASKPKKKTSSKKATE